MARKSPSGALLPTHGYSRPQLTGSDGVTVRVVGEDGQDLGFYDFGHVEAPANLVRALVSGFAKATGPGGRWRSISSVRAGAGMLRQFAHAITAANPDLCSIKDLSPQVWWKWRNMIESRQRWPGQINLVRALLYDVEQLPEATRQALRGKAKKPKKRAYDAYSEAEFRRIRATAWRVARSALKRITTNLQYLTEYRAGKEDNNAPTVSIQWIEWSRGEILDHISQTGVFPHPNGLPYQIAGQTRRMLNVSRPGNIAQAIFASNIEIYALMILFVCERGYNASVLDGMTVTTNRADDHEYDPPIYVADLDKPRRGPESRYFQNPFTGTRGRLWELAIALTEPARTTLAELGHSTDSLLVGISLMGRSTHETGIFRTDWSQAFTTGHAWHSRVTVLSDDGSPLRITLRRLRLTEQVINQRSRQNSDVVSEQIYRNPDPHTYDAATETIVKGQADAIEHASATVRMRQIDSHLLSQARRKPAILAKFLGVTKSRAKLLIEGQLNTPIGACLNFRDSPFAKKRGDPCPASFFACFACGNAVATPEHLPRLVALHDALLAIASAVSPSVWESDFARHSHRLADLLNQNSTDAEIDKARREVTEKDQQAIELLLNRKLDQ